MNNKQIITLIVVAVAAMAVGYFIGTGSNGVKSESQITMKNQSDSLNYFLGLNWGYSVGEAPWEIDADLLASGLLQVLNDSSSFDPMSAQAVFRDLSMALSDVEAKKAEEESMSAMEDGISFLEENGKRDGVVTTESGLQYEVITKGDGPIPVEESLGLTRSSECTEIYWSYKGIDGKYYISLLGIDFFYFGGIEDEGVFRLLRDQLSGDGEGKGED